MNKVVLYCRPGFEKECAAEITDKAARLEVKPRATIEDNLIHEQRPYVSDELHQLTLKPNRRGSLRRPPGSRTPTDVNERAPDNRGAVQRQPLLSGALSFTSVGVRDPGGWRKLPCRLGFNVNWCNSFET